MTIRDEADPSLGSLMGERRQLINLGYRLLGSLTDAEDVVQETYARWYAMSRQQQDAIASPGAWLTTVASRICLDLLGSARARRERYVGQWLPEPVPDRSALTEARPGADPADRVALDESVNMAFLVVLDSMTPAERVAFVLHDVFRYPFAEVGEIVGRSPAACRQLATSARRRVGAAHTATPATQRATVVREFKEAWEAKDIDAIIGLLDPDVIATGDGGGHAAASPHPIRGAEVLANYMFGLMGLATDLRVEERVVNGQPGLVAWQDDDLTVFAFDVVGEKITRLWAMRNPEKLRLWTTS